MGTCSQFDYSESTQPACTNVNVGTDFSMSLTYKNEGEPIDVTGFIFAMTIKDEVGGTTLLSLPIVSDNVTTGLYISFPTNGIITVQITKADTVTVGAGRFPYEMIQTDLSLNESIFMQGTIQFVDRGY